MSTFKEQLDGFVINTKRKVDDLVGNVTVEIANRLDARSPVGDPTTWTHRATIEDNGDLTQHGIPAGYVGGRFRGNWQLGINVIPEGETGRIDPRGSDGAISAIIASVPEHPAGTIMYLANNVPYAQALEDGHSRQAPSGMVGLTAMEFGQIVAQAVDQLK